ncbi:MAG: D-alanyl-D-alanine carboxypeptidase family protein [Clostridia bacterium]
MIFKQNKIEDRGYKKKIKTITAILIFLIVIVTICMLAILAIKMKPEIEINQLILSSDSDKIELENIKQLNLWKKTLSKIKEDNKIVKINYDNYSIILNNENLKKENNIETSLRTEIQYDEWENTNVVEFDVSKIENINYIDQIEIENEKIFQGIEIIDIYGINKNTNQSEFIATKHLEEGNIIIVPNEEYKKYILVYIPITEISIEENPINLFQNESLKLKFKVKPDNATSKIVNIKYDETMLEITEDGSIIGLKEGESEIKLQAENNKVNKTIKVNTKVKTEGIEVASEKIELVEGESKNADAKILPETVSEKTLNYKSINEEIVKVDENGTITAIKAGETTVVITSKAEPIQTREIFVTVRNKEDVQNSNLIANNNSIQKNYVRGVLIVNKNYNLPSNYNPGTNQEALQAFNDMKTAASKSGISLWIVSGFRSYQTQTSIYNRNVGLYGEETANTFSAKPGQSEHQTGLAFDINSTKWSFAETKEAQWLSEHCHEYGFIIRYPQGKQDITGYVYEPWHIRYVGKDLASKIKESGLCLEEYLGIN